jgi:hypothetical protein
MVKMVAKMDQVMAKLQSIRCGHRTDKVWTFAFHASVHDEIDCRNGAENAVSAILVGMLLDSAAQYV